MTGSVAIGDGEKEQLPAVIVTDITGCCGMGLEFTLSNANFPDGYPEPGKVIILIGELVQAADKHYRLQNARLE